MSQNFTFNSHTRPLALGTLYSHTKIFSGSILSAKSQLEVPGTEALGSGSLLNEGVNVAIWNKSRLQVRSEYDSCQTTANWSKSDRGLGPSIRFDIPRLFGWDNPAPVNFEIREHNPASAWFKEERSP